MLEPHENKIENLTVLVASEIFHMGFAQKPDFFVA